MSRMETFVRDGAQRVDLLTALTAQAWLDPRFAAEFAADKHAAVARFAKEAGYACPEADVIEAFELAPNPVGERAIQMDAMPITAMSAIAEGCPVTAQQECPPTTQPGCPSTVSGCGPGGISFYPGDCSGGCPTWDWCFG